MACNCSTDGPATETPMPFKRDIAATTNLVNSLDLHPVAQKMRHNCPKWSEEKLRDTLVEYKRFLILALCHGNAAPCLDVDEIWHTHILMTQKYADDSAMLLGEAGGFLHHEPEQNRGAESRSAKSYRSTLQQYKTTFAEAPHAMWGQANERCRQCDGSQGRCDWGRCKQCSNGQCTYTCNCNHGKNQTKNPSGKKMTLEGEDLGFVAIKITEQQADKGLEVWSPERCVAAESAYKIFLADSNQKGAVTADVDHFWQAHVLFTAQYHEFCASHFGAFYHYEDKTARRCRYEDETAPRPNPQSRL